MSIFYSLTGLINTAPSLVEIAGKAVEVVGEVIDSDTMKHTGKLFKKVAKQSQSNI